MLMEIFLDNITLVVFFTKIYVRVIFLPTLSKTTFQSKLSSLFFINVKETFLQIMYVKVLFSWYWEVLF